jgi:regulator of sigma D
MDLYKLCKKGVKQAENLIKTFCGFNKIIKNWLHLRS